MADHSSSSRSIISSSFRSASCSSRSSRVDSSSRSISSGSWSSNWSRSCSSARSSSSGKPCSNRPISPPARRGFRRANHQRYAQALAVSRSCFLDSHGHASSRAFFARNVRSFNLDARAHEARYGSRKLKSRTGLSSSVAYQVSFAEQDKRFVD